MSKPTERSWMMLKHLGLYLLDARTNVLQLQIKPNGLWYSPETSDGIVLELFSDSDWAAHKATRRSVSACMIFFQGCMLHASSRTQRVVALSSAGAELHSAVSCVCDGILLKHCIVFCLDRPVRLKLILDNSAARQVLYRSGVGRIRQLSCRILVDSAVCSRKTFGSSSNPNEMELFRFMHKETFKRSYAFSYEHGWCV